MMDEPAAFQGPPRPEETGMPGRPLADLVLRNGKIATLVPAPGHSDAPICRPDPFPAIWSMVTRQTDTGRPLGPAQAVGVEEALRAYTGLGAFAGREEHVKGSLEPGKLADVAVLDRDVLTVPADLIRETRVDLTIVGGVVRFRR
jgi:predicted amidohydrolase YtcJ